MENNKSKGKSSREDKTGAAKTQEQIDKVSRISRNDVERLSNHVPW